MAHRRININMRCIEMLTGASNKAAKQGLTLTWDVLKFEKMKKVACGANGLTLTWDVLKWQYILDEEIWRGRLTLTWDVLKYRQINIIGHTDWININMRCIEMYHYKFNANSEYEININMRCIEICQVNGDSFLFNWININMRCIEIFIFLSHRGGRRLRLTLTWDVLKFKCASCKSCRRNRLTLTWDVLKY